MDEQTLRNLIRESLRTRFKFKEDVQDDKPVEDTPETPEPEQPPALTPHKKDTFEDDYASGGPSTPKTPVKSKFFTPPPAEDSYGSTPVQLGSDRPQKVNIKDINPNSPAGDKTVSQMTDDHFKTGRSEMGKVGSFAGYQTHQVPDDLRKPKLPAPLEANHPELDSINRTAATMQRKYGPELAAQKNDQMLAKYLKEYDLLAKHNTGNSEARMRKLADMQKVINGLSHLRNALKPKTEVTEGRQFIDESEGSEEAKKLGLVSKGWGRYADPQTGKIVAKVINGKLTKVTSATDGEPTDASATPDDVAPSPEKSAQPEVPTLSAKQQSMVEFIKTVVEEMKGRKDLEVDEETHKQLSKVFKEGGIDPYKPKGAKWVSPRWNQGMDTHDVPFDANGEETVMKLLALVDDPLKIVRWLLKKLETETPNGKQRILQYLGIIKSMGILGNDIPDDMEDDIASVPTA